QAEDGIRDKLVTGVQTCALPISSEKRGTAVTWARPAPLPLRFAIRELRGGLRGFYVFIACIGLGVMAIAGVGSVASGLANGLAQIGRASCRERGSVWGVAG